MKHLQFPFSFILLLLGFTLPCITHAQVAASIETDKQEIFIGEPISIRIEIEYTEGTEIVWPEIGAEIGSFDVLSQDTILKQRDISPTVAFKNLVVSCYDSGYFAIPPFAFLHSNGSGWDTTQTDSIFILSSFVKTDQNEAFKDINDPLHAPINFGRLLLIVLGLVHLVFIILVVIVFIRKAMKEKTIQPTNEIPADQPISEWAIESLVTLERQQLWQAGEIKQYYTRLTNIIRLYIENRFDVKALESTSDELLQGFRIAKGATESSSMELNQILQTADYVKFAKVKPLPEENHLCLEYAKNIVKSCGDKPQIDPTE